MSTNDERAKSNEKAVSKLRNERTHRPFGAPAVPFSEAIEAVAKLAEAGNKIADKVALLHDEMMEVDSQLHDFIGPLLHSGRIKAGTIYMTSLGGVVLVENPRGPGVRVMLCKMAEAPKDENPKVDPDQATEFKDPVPF